MTTQEELEYLRDENAELRALLRMAVGTMSALAGATAHEPEPRAVYHELCATVRAIKRSLPALLP